MWKRPKCPSADEWTICINSAIKRNEILGRAMRMNLENIMLSEISQTQKYNDYGMPLL